MITSIHIFIYHSNTVKSSELSETTKILIRSLEQYIVLFSFPSSRCECGMSFSVLQSLMRHRKSSEHSVGDESRLNEKDYRKKLAQFVR